MSPAAALAAGSVQTATLPVNPPIDPNLVQSLPALLGDMDSSRYAAIFALQDEANWKAADAQIVALADKSLLGTVLAQRYLSVKYHTSFVEAREWLEHYADLPEAQAVWVLAKKRAAGKPIPSPILASAQVASPIVTVTSPGAATVHPATDAGVPKLPAEPRGVNIQPPARFEAGLASWRNKKYAEAATSFEAVSRSTDVPSWYVAAGAFWAARAHLVLREPQKVDPLLETAAQQPRTFYGLLARRMLGVEPDMRFGATPLAAGEIAQLEALPGGRRALALVQVGETDRAEAELRALTSRSTPGLADAIVALADLANMPALCLALSSGRKGADDRHDDAAYPVPRWEPRNGFSVDRALLFALMMQESRFDADAQSGSGAAGLMQLMPETARSVARRAGIHFNGVDDLVDPVLNLSIGQEYVKQLIEHAQINGNLILLLAAYNSGTAPLNRWQNQPEYQHDPLLFIESLATTPQRLYVERVLTNMWIYRQRLGQMVPDLDALAANEWPTYVSANASSQGVQHAAAR
ncbi:MAG TPA: lytic transglycosylase domain-containing protein [Aliidongia sp.]|uniref:lytic transglycosylase domain-containing protein n=1 Tax=Aliidongia sp. TaxID=1914230 RepID=UPI002DDD2817|nr:lytic transglycosylase domain-containing protein [Aliidongia sp.]HEV2673813.1 lytic transglycosylase domain-containing protein [Aliidongia sp.]